MLIQCIRVILLFLFLSVWICLVVLDNAKNTTLEKKDCDKNPERENPYDTIPEPLPALDGTLTEPLPALTDTLPEPLPALTETLPEPLPALVHTKGDGRFTTKCQWLKFVRKHYACLLSTACFLDQMLYI